MHVNSINSVTQYSSYPTPNHVCMSSHNNIKDDDEDIPVVASNCTTTVPHLANAMCIDPTHTIADTGATSVFVMAGAASHNIRLVKNPITISLPNGKQISSTHMCDIFIPGLPHSLFGHIVPEMKMAALLGIRILCKADWVIMFDDKSCPVNFKGKTILRRTKGPKSNL